MDISDALRIGQEIAGLNVVAVITAARSPRMIFGRRREMTVGARCP
jgi:hypothetical protein